MPLEILTAPKIAESEYPQGVNRVLHVDRLTAAQEERPTWTPTPPPAKPAAAQQIREAAAAAAQESLDAKNRALQLEADAVALEHGIYTAAQNVRQLETKLLNLESQDFLKQGAEARAAIKAGIENCDISDPTRAFDRMAMLMLRAEAFHKIHVEAVRETKAELAKARAHLKAITEEKI